MTRYRDLGLTVGLLTGPSNAITDVEGVRVGVTTLIERGPFAARNGADPHGRDRDRPPTTGSGRSRSTPARTRSTATGR